MSLGYPEETIWFVRASLTDGTDKTEGSAIAVRLQELGQPDTAKTYLLTCAHVVRGIAADGQAGYGPLLPVIQAWPPNTGFTDNQARRVRIAERIKALAREEVPVAARFNTADDWVVLEILKREDAEAAPTVRTWVDGALSGRYWICGFPGVGSFSRDIVVPTRTPEPFPIREESLGSFRLTGDGTRAGFSGGGVFGTGGEFAGVHRGRNDGTLQLCGVSGSYIKSRFYEKGFQLTHRPDRTEPPRLMAGVPGRPDYFVARHSITRNLKARLLNETSGTGELQISVIHGMPGVGKLTIAIELANDPDVLDEFRDGVLWAKLGQNPNLNLLINGWLMALGGHEFTHLDLENASMYLRTLLYRKKVLLVVDDAWETNHVQHFIMGGPGCHVVITARDAFMARAFEGKLFDVGIMSKEEGLDLIARRIGWATLAGEELSQASELAEEVEYLPLVLELSAAQVADGVPLTDLLRDLKDEARKLKALEDTDIASIDDESILKRLSLRVSFNLSLRRLPEPIYRNFVWLGLLSDDVVIRPALARTLWNTPDERSARDYLRYLKTKALLLSGESRHNDGPRQFRIHDLLHTMARRLLSSPPRPDDPIEVAGLGVDFRDAHVLLIERYRAQLQGALWHSLQDDGYIHAHLIWHLECGMFIR